MAVTYSALRQRYLDDIRPGGPGATPALTQSLEVIGWRAVREPSPEELAAHLFLLLDACIYEHHDVALLEYAVATALRDAGPWLDGGMPPVESYLPAAAALLEHYIRGGASRIGGVDWSELGSAE
ncbi:MAG: hypothetical protein RLZZ621_2348 [Gemmatimonadota bacterium]|jgi:hypothetical protein